MLVLGLLLFLPYVYADLTSTFLNCVEFGNTPLDNVFALSDGKYVSLMGMPSRVFSLSGDAIVFEQSVPSADSYCNALKGNGDTFYAVTKSGILDVYRYDHVDGLHLLSSIDLGYPADNSVSRALYYSGFALANGLLILEYDVKFLSGEERFRRSIVNVNDPSLPHLISRTYIDSTDRYTGFYYQNGHYIYIAFSGALYTSDTPTASPDSLDIPGLDQLSIHYSKQIEDRVYAICSNSAEEYMFAQMDFSNINAPTLSLMHSTQLRNKFDISMDSQDVICVTGMNSENIWQIDKYLITNPSKWQLLDSANFIDLVYKLLPIPDGYFVAGIYDAMILDSQLVIQTTLNETSAFFMSEVLLGRYLILEEYTWDERLGSRVFDLQTEQFLDFFNDGYLAKTDMVHGANKIVFISENVDIVEFDGDGISNTWSIPKPYGVSRAAVSGDLLALSGYIDGEWRISIYSLTESGIVLQSDTIMPHFCSDLYFYDANHVFVNRYTESDYTYLYFYRIEQNYSLTYLIEMTCNGTNPFILDNAIIIANDGGGVIDTTNPDYPILSHTISLPTYGGWGCSYDGQGHLMLNDYFHSFILDSSFQLMGYLEGNNLCFYQSGSFLNPGPAGVVSAHIDNIVSNDDILFESVEVKSIRNYPNPFQKSTVISYELDIKSEIEIKIYNIRGQLVRKLFAGNQAKGEQVLAWEGCADDASILPAGVYLLQIRANGKVTKTLKMLKL